MLPVGAEVVGFAADIVLVLFAGALLVGAAGCSFFGAGADGEHSAQSCNHEC